MNTVRKTPFFSIPSSSLISNFSHSLFLSLRLFVWSNLADNGNVLPFSVL